MVEKNKVIGCIHCIDYRSISGVDESEMFVLKKEGRIITVDRNGENKRDFNAKFCPGCGVMLREDGE
jgi:Pyruvate/2-oxoacid:ferredoxin oxidoreductase delta subunit